MADLRVRLLGDVAVEHNGVPAPRGSAALQTLLALLALEPGTPIAGDTLVAQLWPDHERPQHPAATLHTRMTRLRGWLGGQTRLTARAGAYTLHLTADQVDLAWFHAAADRALALDTPPPLALAAAETGLAAWRGEPFPGLDAPRLEAARSRAVERRIGLVECRIRALLRLGRTAEAVDDLVPLAAEHPVRESLQAMLVEALHRAGRPREAVEAYLAARRALVEELAVGPGEELRAAYQRVVDERSTAARPPSRRPAMVGREGALTRILDALTADGRIVVVDGEAGIGKSVLLAAARHAAVELGASVVSGAWQDDRAPMAAWFEALGWPPRSMEQAPGPWLRERVVALARDAPVLLALDDAHRADSGSLGVLTLFARTGVPAGAVVVVAARAPDAVAHPDWDAVRAELSGARQVMRLPLGVLTADAVRAVATGRLAHLGPSVAERLAALVVRRSGGHPLHAAALLDVLAAQRDEAAAVAAARRVPERLRPMLEHQVTRLPPATRSALEALAVLSPIDLGALAAVLDRRSLDLGAELRPAVDAGFAVALADRVVLRHDLMADAVHDAVPAATRTHLHHARLGQLPPDADPFVRLRHTRGAAAVLPPVEVAHACLDAGVAAYHRRALAEALALLDDAAPDLGSDPALAVHRGLVLGALGRLEEADDVLDAAVAALAEGDGDKDRHDDGPRAKIPGAELLVLAAVGDEPLGKTVTGDPRRLARLHRVERRALPPGPRFELLAAVVREESLGGTARPDAVAEMRTLAAAAGAGVITRARSRALEARALVEAPVLARERVAVAEDAYRLAEETEDPLLFLDATELLMTAALGAGQVERARKLRAVMAEDAQRWHRPRLIWAGHLVESALQLAEGDMDGADAAASAGFRRGQELGVADAVQGYGVHLMIRHWLAGTADQLVDLTAGAARAAPSIPAWSAGAAVATACAGSLDDAAAHLTDFRRRRAAITGRSFDRPALAMASAAAFRLGDEETARLVLAELPADPEAVVLVGYGAVVVGPATLFTGLAARTLGERALAREHFALAAALTASLGWTPWADAASRLERAIDDPDTIELPLGLGPSRG